MSARLWFVIPAGEKMCGPRVASSAYWTVSDGRPQIDAHGSAEVFGPYHRDVTREEIPPGIPMPGDDVLGVSAADIAEETPDFRAAYTAALDALVRGYREGA